MSPRNSDFPDYEGISVSHADNWDAIKYHAPKSASPSKEQKVGGFQPIKGMVSTRKRREHNPVASPDVLDETTKAAMKDWRNRGLSNSEIQDF